MSSEALYLNYFNSHVKIGPATLAAMVERFGSAQAAFTAPISEFSRLGFSKECLQGVRELRNRTTPERAFKSLDSASIQTVCYDEAHYPLLLKHIATPPPILYYRGNLELLQHKFAIAVVGSRAITEYGKSVCGQIIPALSDKNLTIVSGLALGIDAYAHSCALKAGGATIAVLGSGINDGAIYPKANFRLAQNIIEQGGLIMSEFPVDTAPLPFHFPIRNRIISGISLGTLVIEASQKSGSLITAYHALDQNRDVFAVPGNIFHPNSKGCNQLIQKGAKLVTCAQDILDELDITPPKKQLVRQITINPREESILTLLQTPCTLDDLVEHSKMPTSTVLSVLTLLEMKGMIKKVEDMYYVL